MRRPARPFRYSDFKQAVRCGQVAEVYVGEQAIRGTTKAERDGTNKFNTTRIEDPKLLEELDAARVKYTGEFVSRWLPEVLGWVIPLADPVRPLELLLPPHGGAEGGVMSFAQQAPRLRRRRREGARPTWRASTRPSRS